MSKDRYEFTNPYAGEWNSYELHVLPSSTDSGLTFDTDHWQIEHKIIVTRKPEPIKPGQTWFSSHGNGTNKKIVRHIYFDETVGETVIVYQQPDNTWSALPEKQFRFTYRKETSE